MPYATLSALVARASRSIEPLPATDGGLLARFARARDDAAFGELVRRLGPMVLGVCRRVVRDEHLAEDAFQAAFLVLARRAADVRPPGAVRGWLYGVAVRTAQEARTVAARRRARELPVATLPDRPGEPPHAPDADALRALDEELAALPDHLRTAVVLCELDGLGRRTAAERLGIPEGTLSSRLATARKLLAARLGRRGLVLPAAGLLVLAHATVAPGLVARTAALATPGTSAPAAVVALTKGVYRTMLLARLKTVAFVVLGVGLLGWVALAAAVPADPPASGRPVPPAPAFAAPPEFAPPPRVAAKPLPKGPNRILLRRESGLFILDPDGKNEKELHGEKSEFSVVGAQLSPDGTRFAALVFKPARGAEDQPPSSLHVRELDQKEPGTDLGVTPDVYVWSRDGTEIACSQIESDEEDKPRASAHFIVNARTKVKSPLKLPPNHFITGWSPDGKLFLTLGTAEKPAPAARLYLMNRDGTEHKVLTGAKRFATFGRLSPDGGRVLCADVPLPLPEKGGNPPHLSLSVIDTATGNAADVRDVPLNAELLDFCWAPDGKRIAYLWRLRHEGEDREEVLKRETESHLIVCDPDGRNQRTVLSAKGSGYGMALSELDWR